MRWEFGGNFGNRLMEMSNQRKNRCQKTEGYRGVSVMGCRNRIKAIPLAPVQRVQTRTRSQNRWPSGRIAIAKVMKTSIQSTPRAITTRVSLVRRPYLRKPVMEIPRDAAIIIPQQWGQDFFRGKTDCLDHFR